MIFLLDPWGLFPAKKDTTSRQCSSQATANMSPERAISRKTFLASSIEDQRSVISLSFSLSPIYAKSTKYDIVRNKHLREEEIMKATGAIVPISSILETFVHQVHRWEEGTLNDVDLSILIARTHSKLNKACYCESGVCCVVHEKHASPHQKCVLK